MFISCQQHVIIIPCLLGFQISIVFPGDVRSGRTLGIFEAHEMIAWLMKNWNADFTVEVK